MENPSSLLLQAGPSRALLGWATQGVSYKAQGQLGMENVA